MKDSILEYFVGLLTLHEISRNLPTVNNYKTEGCPKSPTFGQNWSKYRLQAKAKLVRERVKVRFRLREWLTCF